MKKLVLPVLIVCSLLSCKDKDVSSNAASQVSVCGVKDPVRNLPWLKNLIENARQNKEAEILTITLGEYKGRPVFNYYTSYMSCIGCINYNCDGSLIDISKFSEQESKEFFDSLFGQSAKIITIWPEK